MTKGTQTLGMFRNPAALVGYTRQKFMERAVLVADSLGRLAARAAMKLPGPAAPEAHGGGGGGPREKLFVADDAIRILASARRVVSVGCGPGCDLVGIVAFLVSLRQSNGGVRGSEGSLPPVVGQAVLLDWAMPQWRSILEPLRNLLVPEYVGEVAMASCDVGHGLDDDARNGEARCALRYPPPSSAATATAASTLSGSHENLLDVVVISYLLSETRGRWHALLDDVMPSTRMVMVLDPTAWQLHEFRRRYRGLFAYTWLDSSMHHPSLQALEGRVGPAVLLGAAKCR
jgi:hypothetical protein